MSTHEVLVRRITVLPHPNAERLELAQVDDYRCVVGKGLYQTGDLVAYVPEQSVLTPELAKELELDGKLGSGNRVKPVRLRGELSQGVCVPCREGWVEGQNVADELGVTKWTPDVSNGPNRLRVRPNNIYHLGEQWTVSYDVENIKKFPNVIAEGEQVVMTEKLHGTFAQFILVKRSLIPRDLSSYPPTWGPVESTPGNGSVHGSSVDGEVWGATWEFAIERAWDKFHSKPYLFAVSSKGVGSRGDVLKLEDPANANLAYTRVAVSLQVQERMEQVFPDNDAPVTICGEVYGSGVQDLAYGEAGDGLGFRVFDIYLGTRSYGRYLNDDELDETCKALGLERVPVLYRGPFDKAKMLELTDGKETVSGQAKHIREGVVVCPVIERKDPRAGRVKFKSVSADYLTRKGGTEFN